METKTTETKFKLTDKVKVTDSQFAYYYYSRMFEKMGFKNKLENVVEDISGIWEVFAISKNVNQPKEILLGLSQGEKELLISTKDVKLMEPMKMDTMPFKYKEMRTADTAPAKLKNSTQQKRVELIETQKWELIAATATIDNLKLEYQGKLDLAVSALENSLEIKNRTIKKQSDELEKLGETCGNLVRTKLRNESTIKDLTKRNGNLKTITNDQTERIEVMQHELKNYESAVVSLEGIKDALNKKLDKFEEFNKYLLENETKINESRERLASKFTNWFIFLVLTNIVSIAWGVYQLLTK